MIAASKPAVCASIGGISPLFGLGDYLFSLTIDKMNQKVECSVMDPMRKSDEESSPPKSRHGVREQCQAPRHQCFLKAIPLNLLQINAQTLAK
jgi:hypothetical protein